MKFLSVILVLVLVIVVIGAIVFDGVIATERGDVFIYRVSKIWNPYLAELIDLKTFHKYKGAKEGAEKVITLTFIVESDDERYYDIQGGFQYDLLIKNLLNDENSLVIDSHWIVTGEYEYPQTVLEYYFLKGNYDIVVACGERLMNSENANVISLIISIADGSTKISTAETVTQSATVNASYYTPEDIKVRCQELWQELERRRE